MLRSRIRSALYIDFENVPLPPDAIANWLAWLEDGAFEPSRRRRRFVQKLVYWNSHAERNRELFQKHGFVPILVGKFSGLKNGADIRMAMDVVEATYTRSEIQEFILLTGDSDFVPVLERLKHKSKRSAIVATEHRPNIHTTYLLNADILIPSRRLSEAAQYRRPTRGLLDRLLMRRPLPPVSPRPAAAPSATTVAQASPKPATVPRPARPAPVSTPNASDPTPPIEAAAKRVAKLLTQQPRNYVAQKRVLAELDRVQGFKRQGPTAFLGLGSYRALMTELARIEPRITVIEQPGGGTGVVFVPPPPASGDATKPIAAVRESDAPAAAAMAAEVATDAGEEPARITQAGSRAAAIDFPALADEPTARPLPASATIPTTVAAPMAAPPRPLLPAPERAERRVAVDS